METLEMNPFLANVSLGTDRKYLVRATAVVRKFNRFSDVVVEGAFYQNLNTGQRVWLV